MKIFKVLLILVLPVFFFSCATPSIVFNDMLDNDSVAIINFNSTVSITEYNGIAVEWKPPLVGKLLISIPGGDTLFILNGISGTYNMGYTTYRNIPFRFNFENGKEYSVAVNQHMIFVYRGKKGGKKNHIASFNMAADQKLIMSEGVRIRN